MAEDHRGCEDEGADTSAAPVVDVAAADAGVVYGEEDIVGGGGREDGFGLLFEGYFVGGVKDEGEVLVDGSQRIMQ